MGKSKHTPPPWRYGTAPLHTVVRGTITTYRTTTSTPKGKTTQTRRKNG